MSIHFSIRGALRPRHAQVYALDQRLVDPRRPRKTKLTPEEVEERLIPYYDTFPMSPTQFVTYSKQVSGRGFRAETWWWWGERGLPMQFVTCSKQGGG